MFTYRYAFLTIGEWPVSPRKLELLVALTKRHPEDYVEGRGLTRAKRSIERERLELQ